MEDRGKDLVSRRPRWSRMWTDGFDAEWKARNVGPREPTRYRFQNFAALSDKE